VRSPLSNAIGAINSWVDNRPARGDAMGSLGLPPLSAYIVIDGASVAWSHGDGKRFSVQGLRAAVEFFTSRGLCLPPKPETSAFPAVPSATRSPSRAPTPNAWHRYARVLAFVSETFMKPLPEGSGRTRVADDIPGRPRNLAPPQCAGTAPPARAPPVAHAGFLRAALEALKAAGRVECIPPGADDTLLPLQVRDVSD